MDLTEQGGSVNMKAIIYNRTSTKEQNPELQLQDCLIFCKEKNLEVVDKILEQGSAYKKDKVREEWEKVIQRAKQEKLNIVLWRYDRAFRNRKEFFEFMKVMFEVYQVKVYSVKEPSIISFWNMLEQSYSDNPVMNELIKGIFKTLWDFLIQQAGEEAEEESRKKSDRVKLSIVKTDSEGNTIKTISYKGNKWGRKLLSEETNNKIIEAYKQGRSLRQITKEVFYWDKNRNQKFVSLGYVHKLLTKFKGTEAIV
jgi:DNA invertase Pin-like site-specific DNA recombinase